MCHKFMAHPLFSFLRSFFHRISRMNRRHSCLSDYSRIFADIWPLANGWRPKYSLIVFVTQISQMTQIFLRGSFFCPTDFADIHRFSSSWFFFIGFHGWIGGILAYRITHGISQNFGRWPMAGARYMLLLFFVPQISQIYTDFLWNLWWISLSVSGGICNDRTGRIRENPWVIALAGNLRINSVSSDE